MVSVCHYTFVQTQRMNFSVNYGLWVMMLPKCRIPVWTHDLVENVDNKGSYAPMRAREISTAFSPLLFLLLLLSFLFWEPNNLSKYLFKKSPFCHSCCSEKKKTVLGTRFGPANPEREMNNSTRDRISLRRVRAPHWNAALKWLKLPDLLRSNRGIEFCWARRLF